jgi:anaerobic selenocysteine-containing dehydrogenase
MAEPPLGDGPLGAGSSGAPPTAGARRSVRSVCHSCHGGCGVRIDVVDGRVERISGDPESPFSRGYICRKGIGVPRSMYDPSRILQPLERDGPRGSGRWRKIGWDEALGKISERIDALRTEFGPECIALGQGTARHHYLHVRRFANALGTPNWYEPGLANCFIPRVTASIFTYGRLFVGDYYGAVTPRTMLIWGCNPAVSNPDGKLAFRITRALQAGAHGIAIDPRRSETARLCDEWLPIRPGTDAALALALLHVILDERLEDAAFVERWVNGADRLRQHVRSYTPSWAAEITGVAASQIVSVARRYATEKPGIIEWGVSLDQNVNSLQTARAVCLLRALTGNLDVAGGEVCADDILAPYPFVTKALKKSALDRRLGAKEFPLLGGYLAVVPSAHIPALLRSMEEGEPYRTRALLLFGNNPLLTVADSQRVSRALAHLDLMVATDMFMTPSAAVADYVLPAAFWTELDHVTELPAFAPCAVMVQRKVVQVGEARSDEEILTELSRRLKLPDGERSVHQILDERLQPLEHTFESARERVTLWRGYEYHKHDRAGFRTPSRRVEGYSMSLKKLGLDPLPTYRQPPESPSNVALAREFPCVLTTGQRRPAFFHSEGRQLARAELRAATAEIHPDTAATASITDGSWMLVSSPRGSIRVRARVTPNIMPGVVAVEHGAWDPNDPSDYTSSNVNVLTSSAPPYDPAFGSSPLRGLLCNVRKLT